MKFMMSQNGFGSRYLGIVILYHPDVDQIKINISRYLPYIDKLLLWDNTPNDNGYKDELISIDEKKIIYKTDGRNRGISAALNYAVTFAANNKFDFLLTMDQDSYWQNFDVYIQCHNKLRNIAVGIYSPSVNSSKIHDTASEYTEVDHAITSGSIFPIKMVNRIGSFRSDFFVDGIDIEYGYRAKSNGYKTIRINSACLMQIFGKNTPRKLLGFKYSVPEYPACRLYEILRNHIIVWRTYPTVISKQSKRTIVFTYFFRFFIDILLFQDKKSAKLSALISGVFDGLRYRIKSC